MPTQITTGVAYIKSTTALLLELETEVATARAMQPSRSMTLRPQREATARDSDRLGRDVEHRNVPIKFRRYIRARPESAAPADERVRPQLIATSAVPSSGSGDSATVRSQQAETVADAGEPVAGHTKVSRESRDGIDDAPHRAEAGSHSWPRTDDTQTLGNRPTGEKNQPTRRSARLVEKAKSAAIVSHTTTKRTTDTEGKLAGYHHCRASELMSCSRRVS
ncbi:hypothetical protein DAEQUDRAFT_351861 [Daedalea quercina L-15889]|uniref:Uncharacterized protein n=1 Tax=Daedalea quercina L-15889 TaxID=1314783 RepID=A0A165TP33_9APHY|nr:hypothetical protein DAEQUDRAFT_351861 [Daedalea quercina L-15889]